MLKTPADPCGAMRWLLAILLVLAPLTGCITGDDIAEAFDRDASDRDGDGLRDEPRPGPGDPATHGPPTVDRGEIHTQEKGDMWEARQSINITNDMGGALEVSYAVTVPAGGIAASHQAPHQADQDDAPEGYRTHIVLRAQAVTEEQARQGVRSMELEHSDTLEGTTLHLRTEVRTLPQGPGDAADLDPADVVGATATTRSAGVELHLPDGPHYALDLATGAGGIAATGAFPTVHATTGAGGIDLGLVPWASGTVTAETQAGGVAITLDGGSANGYDAQATTQAGGVQITLPDAEDVGEQSSTHQHKRTRGFSDRPLQTTVQATTQAGGVTITAS